MKAPWFRIVEIVEERGRSMADICNDVATEFGITVTDMRGARQDRRTRQARQRFYVRMKAARPDISSNQIANYIRRDGSTIRHCWSRQDWEQAA